MWKKRWVSLGREGEQFAFVFEGDGLLLVPGRVTVSVAKPCGLHVGNESSLKKRLGIGRYVGIRSGFTETSWRVLPEEWPR